MRQLATIQKIADVQPIEGADSIERVKVNDWWCVAKKGEFGIGDTCVYFEIDSLLPKDNPVFSFLAKGTKEKTMIVDGITYVGYRLKTIKLRGQVSQGLALPLRMVFPGASIEGAKGLDVSENLKIVKYEAPIPAQLAGKMKGNFPLFLKKTDEERIQNLGKIIDKHRELGTKFYVAEKLDGSSATFYKKDGVFGVCSRNIDLMETEGNSFWEIARRYDIENKLADNTCIQGELVDAGIQQNSLGLVGTELYIYNAYNIDTGTYLDIGFLETFCMACKLKIVPILERDIPITETVDALLLKADGKSALNPEAKREGLVYRPMTEMKETISREERRFSFKVISNDYLLSE